MKKKNLSKIMVKIFPILLFMMGSFLFLYPIISNFLVQKNQATLIKDYQEVINNQDTEELKNEWQKAIEYNENLVGDPLHDPFVLGSGYALPDNYLEVLNYDDIMGYIEIPKINVKIPIYHGSSKEVLEKGIGHLESTSLPIGGKATHAVLTGHRGLPSAKLFTDLDKLELGDLFYISVLDEIHAYRVIEIKVVEPEEIKNIQIMEDGDFITLITCTPYGVNTHRLLVKGERTEYIPEEKEEPKLEILEKVGIDKYQISGIFIGIILLLLIIFVVKMFSKIRNKREEKNKDEE